MKRVILISAFFFFEIKPGLSQDVKTIYFNPVKSYLKKLPVRISGMGLVKDINLFKYPKNLLRPFIVKELNLQPQTSDYLDYMSSNDERGNSVNQKKIIKNKIHVLVFENKVFRFFILDSNNNSDFSDDRVYKFRIADLERPQQISSSKYIISEKIPIEYFYQNKVYPDVVLFVLFPFKSTTFKVRFNDSLENRLFILGCSVQNILKSKLGDLEIFAIGNLPIKLYQKDNVSFILVYKGKRVTNLDYRINDYFEFNNIFWQIQNIDTAGKSLSLKQIRKNEKLVGFEKGFYIDRFKFKTFSNDSVSLDNFRGRYVVIDLWASWCIPCIEGIPVLKELYSRYKGKNYAQISICTDANKDIPKALGMIRQYEMNWIQVASVQNGFSLQDISAKYRAEGIPLFFLLDPEGKIIFRGNNVNSLAALSKALKHIMKF
jgi:thiol-disulfide isomerase/thioredoxin